MIHYSRATKKLTVLLDKLWFGNGVALPTSEDFVIVADSHASRIMKVWLKGAQKGKSAVFYDGLPGGPDNLTFDDDGIWVPLAAAADEKHPMGSHLLAPYPKMRKFLVHLLELIKMPFEFISSVYPNRLTNFVSREFGSMDMLEFILPPRRTVIHLNWDGKVVKSFHGSDKTAGVVTHVMPIDDFLYLGSVTSDYIARVKLNRDE